jgi:dTDP-4-dehydrorhamnose 3,5-epimerase
MAGIAGLDEALKDAASVTSEGSSLQPQIAGVELRRPPTHADERGTITEIFDLRWGFSDDPLVYVYHVTVTPGRIKGWVLHREQNDRLFAYAGVLKIVLYDARTDSETFGSVNVFHLGSHDRALLGIPAGVWHAVQNVGDQVAAFINLPSRPYEHDDPDKYRLPLDNDVIPYRLTKPEQPPGARSGSGYTHPTPPT